jgi:hypothetical protein
MRRAEDLTKEELVKLANRIQAILYVDFSPDEEECRDSGFPKEIPPNSEYFDPDKEWDEDTLDAVARTLDEHGLRPTEPCPT